MAGNVKPIPEGYHSVTPYLYVKGAAKALEFYKQALGATEKFRMPMADGRVGHAEITIGDSVVMLADEFPERNVRGPQTLGGVSSSLMIYVEEKHFVCCLMLSARNGCRRFCAAESSHSAKAGQSSVSRSC